MVPLLRLVPWWGLLGICYFFASQGLEETADYREVRDQAILHGNRPAVTLVPLEQFNTKLDAGGNREVFIAAKRIDLGLPMILKAEKYIEYAIIPLAGLSEEMVRGVAIEASRDGRDLQAYIERHQDSAGRIEINGQYDPPTPWLGEAAIRYALEKRGYVLGPELILVEPYTKGRMSVMLSDAQFRWFWISLAFTLSTLSGLAGLWKLRRWLSRLGAPSQ